jgi:predicted ATPase/class 3 adenylate cyclase/serine/threonine protein kinase
LSDSALDFQSLSAASADFQVVEHLYQSEVIQVIRARSPQWDRNVILKTLKGVHPTPENIVQIKREFDVLKRIKTIEGCSTCLGLVEWNNTLALVLEDAKASSLAHHLNEGKWPLDLSLDLGVKLCSVLRELHQKDVVHKDINPSNILWNSETGSLELIDFGISSVIPRQMVHQDTNAKCEGTLAYIAPEQTGRMNRHLDHRSDIYALGITLFQMFSRTLPFQQDDPLQLIHSHLAIPAPQLTERDANIPEVLSNIVSKCLSKNPDERYQNVTGLQKDLQKALTAWQESSHWSHFEIGQEDAQDRLQQAQILYGRSTELSILRETFSRCAHGPLELLLIGGYSGIGKTSLVREIQVDIGKDQGMLLMGKFDQFHRDLPYDALLQMLRQMLLSLLSLDTDKVEQWKQNILAATEPDTGVLLEVLPELEQLVGECSQVGQLPLSEAEHRFRNVFVKFIQCLSSSEQPLLLFIDDLQWADQPSLQILESLCMSEHSHHLFVVGAYRDNEVQGTHPLINVMGRLKNSDLHLHEMKVLPLGEADIAHWLSDILSLPEQEVAPLSKLCYNRTQGNPFFIQQLLDELDQQRWLRFDAQLSKWTWSMAEIEGCSFTENVVEFLSTKINGMGEDMKKVLNAASVFGNEFYLDHLLSLELELSKEKIYEIMEQSEKINFIQSDGLHFNDEGKAQHYWFAHDRIQQAAYTSIPETQRNTVHAQLGVKLWRDCSTEDRPEQAIHIVQHLNHGYGSGAHGEAHRESLVARMDVLECNHMAGAAAMHSAAYTLASEYFSQVLQHSCDQDWQDAPTLLTDTHLELAKAHCLNQDYDAMELILQKILSQDLSPLNRAKALDIRTSSFNARHRLEDAVRSALEALQILDIHMPFAPKQTTILSGLLSVKWLMRGAVEDEILMRPACRDDHAEFANHILTELIAPAFYTSPNLLPLIGFEMVKLAMKKGLTSHSSYGFSIYGLVLISIDQIQQGYAMGKLAMACTDIFEHPRLRNRTEHMFNTHIRFWVEPYRASLQSEQKIFDVASHYGDHVYAAFGAYMYSVMSIHLGRPLRDCLTEQEQYDRQLKALGLETSVLAHKITMQKTLNLTMDVEHCVDMEGPHYIEKDMLPLHEKAGDATNLFVFYAEKIHLCVIFREFKKGVDLALKAFPLAKAGAGAGSIYLSEFYTHAAICLLQDNELGSHSTWIKRCQKRLTLFSRHSEQNNAHRLKWVQAEIAKQKGKVQAAISLYEEAIQMAEACGISHEIALIHEFAGRFYFGLDKMLMARVHIVEATHTFQAWGASSKVKDLFMEFSQNFPQMDRRKRNRHGTQHMGEKETMDLQTVLKASQAMSGEIVLDDLLSKLMSILMENAGAEKLILILLEKQQSQIVATAHSHNNDIEVGLREPLAGSNTCSNGIVQYVLRTGKSVVLNDASKDNDFNSDHYLKRSEVKSLLCSPVVHQGKNMGVLYMENNLSCNVFTPERLKVLNMLSSQAAISIDNAHLYNNLESIVKDRTEQLEKRNSFIRQTFGRYLSDDVVESLLQREEGLEMGGELRKLTIMMTDLRGFTSMSAALPAEDVVSILNHYLSTMTDIVMKYGGTIDEFIGDAILVIFGAPLLRHDDAERAVACAIEMQNAMEKINLHHHSKGYPEIEMGIGIHTDEIVVGNIGSNKRAKYGVVGSGVNMTGRIESKTVGGQILISESTQRDIQVELETSDPQKIPAKGLKEPIEICEVLGIGGRHQLQLQREDLNFVALNTPLSIQTIPLESKSSEGRAFEVQILAFSSKHFRCSPVNDDIGKDYKFIFELPELGEQDVYAKMTDKNHDWSELRLTACSPAVKAWILEQMKAAAGV